MYTKSKAKTKRRGHTPLGPAKVRADESGTFPPPNNSSKIIGEQSPSTTWPIIEVSTYFELRSKLAEINSFHNRPSFRGQVRDYGRILCSIARKLSGITTDTSELIELNSDRTVWLQATSKLAERLLPDIPMEVPDTVQLRELLAEAFLQHYGYQTHFIDATWDLDVAVCFALLEYNDLFPMLEGKPGRPKFTRVAWYEQSKEPYGFIYVFDSRLWTGGEIQHGDLIDLTKLAPPGYNRIQEQQGVVLHAELGEPGPGDLARFVKAVYKFPNPLPGSGPALIRYPLLFPNPGADAIYRTLLSSRFIELTYVTDRVFQAVRRTSTSKGQSRYQEVKHAPYKEIPIYVRPLDIPEYHIDFKTTLESDIYRAYDRILQPMFYFPWLKKHVNSVEHRVFGEKFSQQRRKWRPLFESIKDAKSILLNSPLTTFASLDPRLTTKRFESPERTINVFMEFSFYNFVGPFSEDDTIRGIWLAGDKKSFLINVFGAAHGKPWMGEFCSFEWQKEGYTQTVKLFGHDMNQYFLMALHVLRAVAENEAEIVAPKRGEEYHQFRWKAESRWWESFGRVRRDSDQGYPRQD